MSRLLFDHTGLHRLNKYTHKTGPNTSSHFPTHPYYSLLCQIKPQASREHLSDPSCDSSNDNDLHKLRYLNT